MKEKVISDIRVFKSCIPNIDGNALPSDINNKKLNIVLHRIVMKLRENGFSLGEILNDKNEVINYIEKFISE